MEKEYSRTLLLNQPNSVLKNKVCRLGYAKRNTSDPNTAPCITRKM